MEADINQPLKRQANISKFVVRKNVRFLTLVKKETFHEIFYFQYVKDGD